MNPDLRSDAFNGMREQAFSATMFPTIYVPLSMIGFNESFFDALTPAISGGAALLALGALAGIVKGRNNSTEN